MLYKFKSKAAGDVIMLEPNGRRLLEIVGKDSGPQGIILPGEMAAAIAKLEAAIAQEDAASKDAAGDAGKAAPKGDGVSLRQRAVPFIDLLKRSSAAGNEVVWGV